MKLKKLMKNKTFLYVLGGLVLVGVVTATIVTQSGSLSKGDLSASITCTGKVDNVRSNAVYVTWTAVVVDPSNSNIEVRWDGGDLEKLKGKTASAIYTPDQASKVNVQASLYYKDQPTGKPAYCSVSVPQTLKVPVSVTNKGIQAPVTVRAK